MSGKDVVYYAGGGCRVGGIVYCEGEGCRDGESRFRGWSDGGGYEIGICGMFCRVVRGRVRGAVFC
ncbi:MAG: hypothetical protein JW984_05355 [Deltaproteobacteria bacterium]|uniref:Uncharacterized protein n=1 Tax=Candidatus Zymogenus saltonus TaxID=2844893 RepID=A0A9D8KEE4_9DELT|nr:hypothetical protein [Candidatus Zymogenus saltonus]